MSSTDKESATDPSTTNVADSKKNKVDDDDDNVRRDRNDDALDKERKEDNVKDRSPRRRSRSRDRRRRRRYKSRSPRRRRSSDDDDDDDDERSERKRRRRSRSRSSSRHRRRRRSETSRRRRRRRSRSRSRSEEGMTPTERAARKKRKEMEELTRDVRTVFVSQLQVRATEKDIKRFFKKIARVKVNDIRLIKDRYTNRSKGFAYVELRSLEDVPKALMLNGQRFVFKKGKLGFPVQVKASEAEKNYAWGLDKKTEKLQSRRLFIGNIHVDVSEDDLKTVLEPFGGVESVQMAKGPHGNNLGHCVVQFSTTDVAERVMSKIDGLDLAGKQLVVRKAETTPVTPALSVVAAAAQVATGTTGVNVPLLPQFPQGTTNRPLAATGSNTMPLGTTSIQPEQSNASWKLDTKNGGANLNAQSRAMLMTKLAQSKGSDAMEMVQQHQTRDRGSVAPASTMTTEAPVGDPSACMVVKNMFNPSEETAENWVKEIEEDMVEEVSKFGVVKHCFVDETSQGYVYVMFDSRSGGAACGSALHGRYFNRKQLAVQFFPKDAYTAKFGL